MQRSSPLAGGRVQSRFGKTLSPVHIVTGHRKHCMAMYGRLDVGETLVSFLSQFRVQTISVNDHI